MKCTSQSLELSGQADRTGQPGSSEGSSSGTPPEVRFERRFQLDGSSDSVRGTGSSPPSLHSAGEWQVLPLGELQAIEVEFVQDSSREPVRSSSS